MSALESASAARVVISRGSSKLQHGLGSAMPVVRPEASTDKQNTCMADTTSRRQFPTTPMELHKKTLFHSSNFKEKSRRRTLEVEHRRELQHGVQTETATLTEDEESLPLITVRRQWNRQSGRAVLRDPCPGTRSNHLHLRTLEVYAKKYDRKESKWTASDGRQRAHWGKLLSTLALQLSLKQTQLRHARARPP